MALKVRQVLQVRKEALVRQGLLGTLAQQDPKVRQEALAQQDQQDLKEAQDLLEAPEVLVELDQLARQVRQVRLA
jgi:hypothetical protein